MYDSPETRPDFQFLMYPVITMEADFTNTLSRDALIGKTPSQELVDKYTSNWDVERVAFMDNLIISVAVTELLNFDSIPVKVTLDEWIDIAKYYSSPSSSNFINGVLDRAAADLIASGEVAKSGRGLL